MKTKIVLVSVLFILSSVLGVSALYAQSKSATTTLNIKLNPIQTITVNPDQKNVDLSYTTEKHYNDGVIAKKSKHLKVFSTGGFQVKVKSGAVLSNGVATLDIQASDVTVKATASGHTIANLVVGTVALGTEKPFITSEKGGRNLEYDVTYNNELGKSDKYINHYKVNGKNTFTTTVTYTIAAN